jgi:hypothetical protein
VAIVVELTAVIGAGVAGALGDGLGVGLTLGVGAGVVTLPEPPLSPPQADSASSVTTSPARLMAG